MEIGIIGLPQSGKSTLFEIMTGVKSREMHAETCVRGLAAVPDARFDRLVEIFKPEKVSPAKVPFSDVNAVGEKAWDAVRQSLAGAEGLLHVVDAFTAADAAEIVGRCRRLGDELILSDLMIVENRLERLAKMAKKPMTPQDHLHLQALPRLKGQLEAGNPLRELALTEEERHGLRSFSFWTIRPELVVVNTPEDNPAHADSFIREGGLSVPVIGICCAIEAELMALPPGERQEFLDSLGIAEAAFGRIIRAAFSLLGRIAYFTVGEDEVKAWIVPAGTKAPRAAGVIHNDFERGFIKAEVIGFDEFIACGGTNAGAKAAGKLRLEGREYVVRDGDIINFRFNV
ncbi:MAG: YchF family ATPase [Proteobacteria bacterium]|nr:YchF family ATPase [Pseudomonadota bacterium]